MTRSKYVLLLLFTTLIMGTSFPIGKIGLDYAPPFLLMAVRFTVAGGVLALLTAKRRQPSGAQWLQAGLIGLLQSTAVMGCAYYSMNWITSGESSIITSIAPLFVIVISAMLRGNKYGFRQWAGAVIGFGGVVISFGAQFGLSPGTPIGFAGAVFFAIATILIKKWGASMDSLVLAAYQMLAGGMALFVLSWLTEKPTFVWTLTSVSVALWLAVISSIVQFGVWFYLLRNSDPARTSAFLFLVPVFGVLSSALMLGERVAWYVGAGGALIAAGIFLVNWRAKDNAEGAAGSKPCQPGGERLTDRPEERARDFERIAVPDYGKYAKH